MPSAVPFTDPQFAYAKYTQLDSSPYVCVNHLMENSELVWKLLKYNTPDAWQKSDLSQSEKAELIYSGQENLTDFRVFLDTGQPDVWVEEVTILRFGTYSLYPDDRTRGTLSMLLEVYSHYKINYLTNYKTRVDMIAQEFLRVFNGATLGGIGQFYFDIMGNRNARAEVAGQIPFKGRYMIFSNKTN